jgi:hypothetical protein
MRSILGLLIGLYLTCALVVAGGGVYGFVTHQNGRQYDCGAGKPDWIPFVLMRAAIWPKAYYDDMNKTPELMDWLVVKYDPFPSACL